jgi:predicted enzyme related to lactoylglutathione lyase
MKRVTGLGGVFFKTKDPKKIKEWYGKHLGLPMDDYGCSFQWIDKESKAPAVTAWGPFKEDTNYFQPSEKQFMFNYRVENLSELLKVLKEEGVQIVGEIQDEPYGKFGGLWIRKGTKLNCGNPRRREIGRAHV